MTMKLKVRHKSIGIFKKRDVVEIDVDSLRQVFNDILLRMEQLQNDTLTSEEDLRELMELQANATFIGLILPEEE